MLQKLMTWFGLKPQKDIKHLFEEAFDEATKEFSDEMKSNAHEILDEKG